MKAPTVRAKSRRHLLAAVAALAGWPVFGGPVLAHGSFGIVKPPLALPRLPVADLSGRSRQLASLLKGRVTAVQLMFTGCSATCPIQGANFAALQAKLPAGGADLRLLSISIDPLGDDTTALRAWLQRFGANPQRWTAVLPSAPVVDRLLDFLNGRAEGADRHTAQVYFFDRRAELVFRSADMPSSEEVFAVMQQVSARP